jgi:cyanophycin synthetase
VVLYEDQYVRGRQPGEIMALFRKGLASGSRVAEIHDFLGALKAVEFVLSDANPGDLIVIQADDIDTTMTFIERYVGSRADGREIGLSEALASAEREPVGVFADATD